MPTLPPATKALILACVAILCIGLLFPLGQWFALWPLASGQFMPWQLLSYSLLHADLGHLFFNMLGIWMFGAELENRWGAKRYLQFMAACALTAGLAQLLVTSLMGGLAPTVGASGALFGLLMAYALVFPNRQFDLVGLLPMFLLIIPSTVLNLAGFALYIMLITNRRAVPIPPIPVPALTMVAIFGVLELLLGLFFRSGGVAHFAHLGGLLGGWLMLRFWRSQAALGRKR